MILQIAQPEGGSLQMSSASVLETCPERNGFLPVGPPAVPWRKQISSKQALTVSSQVVVNTMMKERKWGVGEKKWEDSWTEAERAEQHVEARGLRWCLRAHRHFPKRALFGLGVFLLLFSPSSCSFAILSRTYTWKYSVSSHKVWKEADGAPPVPWLTLSSSKLTPDPVGCASYSELFPLCIISGK